MNAVPKEARRGSQIPRGWKVNSQPPPMMLGKGTWVLCKSSVYSELLTHFSSPQHGLLLARFHRREKIVRPQELRRLIESPRGDDEHMIWT